MVLIVTCASLIVNVALSVPLIQWISIVPPAVVSVVLVQPPQVIPEVGARMLTVSVELPVCSVVPFTVPSVHVSSTVPSRVSRIAVDPLVRLASTVAPDTMCSPAGQVVVLVLVLQMRVAEAVPAPSTAIRASAATATRPSILTCFIFFSLVRRGEHRVDCAAREPMSGFLARGIAWHSPELSRVGLLSTRRVFPNIFSCRSQESFNEQRFFRRRMLSWPGGPSPGSFRILLPVDPMNKVVRNYN